MGNYSYKKSLVWLHTSDIDHNFKAVDFDKDYLQLPGSNLINTKRAISMKTTITTDVIKWLSSEPIKKNIDFLEQALSFQGLESNGKILKITELAEIHIYMPKINTTSELKLNWMSELNKINPKIKFEIRALEEYIK